MNKLIVHKESCKGCGFCIEFCPRNAISFSGVINKKGYHAVVVNDESCILCGICYNVCPDYVFELIEEDKA